MKHNKICIRLLSLSAALYAGVLYADELEAIIDQTEAESPDVSPIDDYASLIKNSPFLPRNFSKEKEKAPIPVKAAESMEFVLGGIIKQNDGSYTFSLMNKITKKSFLLSSNQDLNNELDVSFNSYDAETKMLVVESFDGLKYIPLAKRDESKDKGKSSGGGSYYDNSDSFYDNSFMDEDVGDDTGFGEDNFNSAPSPSKDSIDYTKDNSPLSAYLNQLKAARG